MQSPTPSDETEQFNHDVQFLLKPQNPNARSLLAFIQRTIRQFDLHTYITAIDIFVEAYLRGVKYTQDHREAIRQPNAWMRRTAYNIIRERKRDRQRYSALAFDELMEQGQIPATAWPPTAIDSEAIDQSIQAVCRAWTTLSAGDRRLIHWKIVEGLTWAEIHLRLGEIGAASLSQTALRKRGQRALERLRRAYHLCHDQPGTANLTDHPAEEPDGDQDIQDAQAPNNDDSEDGQG